jgi:hypothetical protein
MAKGELKDKFEQLGASLCETMGAVHGHQRDAFTHAVEAGRKITEVKQCLADNPTCLQSFPQWFKQHCKGFSLRSANDYERCYKQTPVDSSVRYSSIRECLLDWQKTHPKRERFQAPATEATTLKEESRVLLAEQEMPELPEVDKVSMGMKWWLDEPDIFSQLKVCLNYLQAIGVKRPDVKRAVATLRAYFGLDPEK